MSKIAELEQKGKLLQCRVSKLADEEGGVWRTIQGRAIFIPTGGSVEDAMKKGGIEGEGKGGEAKTTVTMSGWRTEQGQIEYGKTKPITRGQSTYWYLKVGGKERRFKSGQGGVPEDKLKAAVEKLGLKFKRPEVKPLS